MFYNYSADRQALTPASNDEQNQNSKPMRFEELDALRGGAALSVVLFHYLHQYDAIYGKNGILLFGALKWPSGVYGVYLFFMISGFVIFMTLRGARGWLDFVVSRFSRLYPAYWAGIIATAAVGLCFPLPDQRLSLGQIVANLSMVQGFFYVPSVDGVYWTLSSELAFYALMLALFLTRLLPRIEAVSWFWLGVAVAMHLAAPLGFDLPWRITLLFVLNYAQLFVAGIVFYLVWREGYTANRLRLLAACLIVEYAAAGIASAGIVAGFFVLFHYCVTGRLRFLARGLVLWLGVISYPLYLTHQMIGYRAIAAMLQVGVPPPIVIVSTIGGALLLAAGLSFLVERPVMRLIRRWYRRRVTGRRAQWRVSPQPSISPAAAELSVVRLSRLTGESALGAGAANSPVNLANTTGTQSDGSGDRPNLRRTTDRDC